jgi:hypothetical protein
MPHCVHDRHHDQETFSCCTTSSTPLVPAPGSCGDNAGPATLAMTTPNQVAGTAVAAVMAVTAVTATEMASATLKPYQTTQQLETSLRQPLCSRRWARGGQRSRSRKPSPLVWLPVAGPSGAGDCGGCPVGHLRAVMKIKHPGNPKSVCLCIPIAILQQDEPQDLK